MAKYKIEISKTAEKQLKKLPGDIQERIVRRILELADNPLPRGVKKLTGYDDIYRLRTGQYRIIYQIQFRRIFIVILKIGHRRDIYR